jgi:hypothetical protein
MQRSIYKPNPKKSEAFREHLATCELCRDRAAEQCPVWLSISSAMDAEDAKNASGTT